MIRNLLKHKSYIFAFLLLLGMSFSVYAYAANPERNLGFQGQLFDGGTPKNGSVNATFTFYDALTGGSVTGTTITKTITVANGYFGTQFTESDTTGVDFNQQLFIEVTVNGTTLSPRTSVNPTVSSFKTFGTFSYATAPSVGPTGSLYYNSTSNELYVSTGSSWQVAGVVSSTTPTNIIGRAIDPTLVNTIADGGGSAPYFPNGPVSSAVQGNYLYSVSSGAGGQYGALEIMDISNPAAPVHVGVLQGIDSSPYSNNGVWISVSGNYAYIGMEGYDSSFNIIDISNPANPVKVGSYFNGALRQPGRSIISGKYAYVAYSYGNSFAVIDISNPRNPTLVGSLTHPTFLNNVFSLAQSGNFIYAQGAGSYLSVIDVSNPKNPTLTKTIANGTDGAVIGGCYASQNIAISGSYMYVGCDQNNSLNIFDISDRRSPVLKSVTTLVGRAGSNQISGKYLYSMSVVTEVITVTDISNPTSPQVLASKVLPITTPGGWVQNFIISGNYGYIGSYSSSGLGKLFIVDIGGTTISNEEVGSSKIGNLQVVNGAQFNQGVSVVEGLNVGGNALIGGALSITGIFGTTTSTTTTSGNPSLSVGGSYANEAIGTENIFQLVRPLNGAISYAQVATFQLGSYAPNGASNGYGPSTRLDINLKAAPNTTISGDTNVMTLLANGRVGIGTTTPIAKFTVVGASTLPAEILFEIASSTNASLFRIGSNGNVGIGTSTPVAKFSVKGGGTTTGLLAQFTDSANAPKFTVLDSGNLGIGTTTPIAPLSVKGAGTGTGFLAQFTDSANASKFTIFDNGNVGIGPYFAGKLSVNGDAYFQGNVFIRDGFSLSSGATDRTLVLGGYGQTIYIGSNSDLYGGVVAFRTNSIERMRLTNTGLGIGTTTPTQAIVASGTIQSTALLGGITTLSVDASGNIIRTPSDQSLKTNIETLTSALDKVNQMRGVSYTWLDTARFGTSSEIGFIAQELEPIVPEVVKSGGEYKSVNYQNLVALLVEAIKELSGKVTTIAAWFTGEKFNIQNDVCVDTVCVTKEEFKQMLLNAKNGSSLNQTNTVTEPPSEPVVEITPEPEVEESASDPEPEIESVPEPLIVPTEEPISEEL